MGDRSAGAGATLIASRMLAVPSMASEGQRRRVCLSCLGGEDTVAALLGGSAQAIVRNNKTSRMSDPVMAAFPYRFGKDKKPRTAVVRGPQSDERVIMRSGASWSRP